MDVDPTPDTKGKAREILVNVGLEQDQGSSLIAQILGFKFAFYQVGVLYMERARTFV